jgi:hypothetical protein
MKEALIALVLFAFMFVLVGGYFFIARRGPRITGAAFTAVGVACGFLAVWQLQVGGPGTSHLVYGFMSVAGGVGCLLIGISTLVYGGPGRRR